MDKCINKPFKDHMTASWQEWMRQDRAKTKSGNLKQPTRQDAINWVSKAWDSISPDTLIKSFKVCGISNALNGTEDDTESDDLPSVDSEPEDQESESDSDEGDACAAEDDVDDIDPFSDDSDSDSD